MKGDPQFREKLLKMPDVEVMAYSEQDLKLYPAKLYELRLRKAEIDEAQTNTEGLRWRIKTIIAAVAVAVAVILFLASS